MLKNKQIYIYIDSKYTYIYLKYQNKNIIEKNKNIIKNNEITSVKNTLKHFIDIDKKHNIYNGYLKPELIVLYNDQANSDITFLYKEALLDFNYKKIKFIKLSSLINKLKHNEKLLLFEDNYYISFALNKVFSDIDNISFEPIIIGNNNTTYKHYSDEFFVWNSFLRYFTKN